MFFLLNSNFIKIDLKNFIETDKDKVSLIDNLIQ